MIKSEKKSKGLIELHKNLEKIFQEFISEIQSVGDRQSPNLPPADIITGHDSIVIYLDAPGVSGKDVEIAFANGLLTIRGEKRLPACCGMKHHILERNFGIFSRTLPVQVPVNIDRARATLKNGVIEIELPRIQERRKRIHKIVLEEK